MTQKRIHAYLLLLVVSIIWGVAVPVIKYSLNYFTPLTFLTYRFFLSTIVALIYFTFRPTSLPKSQYQITHTLIHSTGVIIFGLGLLFLGLNFTDSLTGNLLSATGPVFTIIFGAYILHERISRRELFGLSLAVAGSIYIVFSGDGVQNLGLFGTSILGNGIILLSRIADSLGSVATKQALNHKMDPIALTHIAFVIGFLTFMILSLFQFGGIFPLLNSIIHAPLSAHLGVFYMAFISGTLGYALANRALVNLEVGESSFFSYLTVVWGTPLSVLWLHDPLTHNFVIGAVIIATGVIIAEWKRRERRKLLKKRKKK